MMCYHRDLKEVKVKMESEELEDYRYVVECGIWNMVSNYVV